ncbi:uncharacterized protein LOC143283486 [Babylonia areolata]|uniref:uncharacterized protein LOC143283486 n=1 Tax=Babylonia areolata TaxID=304850 RepID=UPI003FD23DB4
MALRLDRWCEVFCAEETKLSYQCPSPNRSSTGSLACSVDNCVTTSEVEDLDELGDLLRRFDTFFREKVDTEMQSVREFLHGMLSEQQIHLQQILTTRLYTKSSSSQLSGPHLAGENGFQDHKVPETSEDATVTRFNPDVP